MLHDKNNQDCPINQLKHDVLYFTIPDCSCLAKKVGGLRQWLNEDRITDTHKMVTDDEILTWFLSPNSK